MGVPLLMLVGSVVATGAASPAALPLPRVYYINLDESRDRRAHMESALGSFPGHVERVPAVRSAHVQQPPFSKYLQQQGLDAVFERMEAESAKKTISCWLSHVTLWERLRSELGPQDTALILEDDVLFPQNWTRELNSTLQGAPRGWDVLKLCGWGHSRPEDAVDDTWAIPRWPIWGDGKWLYTGSCGYVVAGSTLPNLLRRVLGQVIKDIDVAMMLPEKAVIDSEYAIYEQTPGRRLFSTGGFSSTIRGPGEAYYLYGGSASVEYREPPRCYFMSSGTRRYCRGHDGHRHKVDIVCDKENWEGHIYLCCPSWRTGFDEDLSLGVAHFVDGCQEQGSGEEKFSIGGRPVKMEAGLGSHWLSLTVPALLVTGLVTALLAVRCRRGGWEPRMRAMPHASGLEQGFQPVPST